MVKEKKLGTVTRMSFAKVEDVLEMPNLIEVQKKSYKWFLDEGLREVLADVFPQNCAPHGAGAGRRCRIWRGQRRICR